MKTGNHSIAELLKLTRGLSHCRFFPGSGSMRDRLECLAEAKTDTSLKALEGFISTLKADCKHVSVRLYADPSNLQGRILVTIRDASDDMHEEHFQEGLAVERRLIDFVARDTGLALRFPANAEFGFDPAQFSRTD